MQSPHNKFLPPKSLKMGLQTFSSHKPLSSWYTLKSKVFSTNIFVKIQILTKIVVSDFIVDEIFLVEIFVSKLLFDDLRLTVSLLDFLITF